MGLPVFREPAAAEPKTKADPTSESRSSIRRQPRVRPSRRYTHFDSAVESPPSLRDLWHSSSRPDNNRRSQAPEDERRRLQRDRYDAVFERMRRHRELHETGSGGATHSDRPPPVPDPPQPDSRRHDVSNPWAAAQVDDSAPRPQSRRGPSISMTRTTLSTDAQLDLERLPRLRRMTGRNIADELPPRRSWRALESSTWGTFSPSNHAVAETSSGRPRSTSPLSSIPDDEFHEPWSNMAVSIIPDETLPSASTSFASGTGAGANTGGSFNASRARASMAPRVVPGRAASYTQTPGVLPGDDFTTLTLSQQREQTQLNGVQNQTRNVVTNQARDDETDWCDDAPPSITWDLVPSRTTFETDSEAGGSSIGARASSLRQECEALQDTLDSFISASSSEGLSLTQENISRMQTQLRTVRRDILRTTRNSRVSRATNRRAGQSRRSRQIGTSSGLLSDPVAVNINGPSAFDVQILHPNQRESQIPGVHDLERHGDDHVDDDNDDMTSEEESSGDENDGEDKDEDGEAR